MGKLFVFLPTAPELNRQEIPSPSDLSITSRSSTIGSRLHSCPSTGMHLFLLLDRVLVELMEVINRFPRAGVVSGGGIGNQSDRGGRSERVGK
jgi:hypothetical protein